MKYVYIVIAMLFIGCVDKSPEMETKVEVVEVAKVQEPKEVVKKEVKNVVPKNETIVEDPKVVKKIGADIPTSCAMWSDGCNVCTRVSNGKASCTTGPECTNKMFSCLQWQ